jgi:hypothetical protein
MFRRARIIKNTMLLFVEKIGSIPTPIIKYSVNYFLPSLSLSLSSLCVAHRGFAFISQKGEREEERIQRTATKLGLLFNVLFPVFCLLYSAYIIRVLVLAYIYAYRGRKFENYKKYSVENRCLFLASEKI